MSRPTSASAAVSRVRRCVSSNSRAFSSATLMLLASVCSRRTSDSLNACSRSTFCSDDHAARLVADQERDEQRRLRAFAGDDRWSRPRAARRAMSLLTSIGWRVRMTSRHEALVAAWRGLPDESRLPCSIRYRIVEQVWSVAVVACRCRAPARRRSRGSCRRRGRRSPACRASTRAPSWTLLMIASSAARCSVSLSRRCVSSKRRAFSSATLMRWRASAAGARRSR